ncbi:MAG: ECF transporter S component [Clostridia bacterium]|nr:ECF transporter S component [Clostridia bacterium]
MAKRASSERLKKTAVLAMLAAIAYVVMAVGRVPVVLFLKYDPKDVVIALGGLIYGPLAAFVISVAVSLIEMVTLSDTGIIGCIMNIVSTCSFACTAAIVYKRKKSLKGAVLGLLLGLFTSVAVMMLWNYLLTPLYMGYPRESVVELLLPAFLPFNLIKSTLNAAFTFLLYKPVIKALRGTGILPKAENAEKSKKPVMLWIIAALMIITAVLFILVLNNVI